MIAFLVAFLLKEPKIDTIDFTFKAYFKQLADGFKQLLKPVLQPFVPVIITLLGGFFLFEWGMVRPTMAAEFGFFDREQAILFALLGIIGAVAVRFIPSYRKIVSDKVGLYGLAFGMSLAFMMAFFRLGYWGGFVLLALTITGQLAVPWLSIVVNREIPSKYRATTLSTVALITKLPYAVLAIVAGSMAQAGTSNLFNLGVGVTIFCILGLGLVWQWQQFKQLK